jgi:NitT/TauT family transport system ATP-binding protein
MDARNRLLMNNSSRQYRKVIVPFVGLILFIAAWHIVSTQVLPKDSTLPPPSRVAEAMAEMWHSGELVEDILASLNRILFGFAIALFGAVVFGIAAARYGKMYEYIKTTMDLLSSIPPIAWTPVAILWFGIGDAPALFIVFLGAFFPMFTSVYSGINRVDSELKNAARTLGAKPSFVVRSVIFPAALPQILTGIRTGIGVAWFNVIAAELIGVRSGLGYKIQLNRTLLFSEHVIGIMLIIGMLGFLMTRIVGIAGNLWAPWAIQDETRPKWIERRRKLTKLIRWRVVNSVASKINEHAPPLSVNDDRPLGSEPILNVKNISMSFEGEVAGAKLEVLRDITFSVNPGEVFSILGPNGSGKTTIINIIAGLLKPERGYVEFLRGQVSEPSHERTVVFQSFALFPWRTCKGNIAFALQASSNQTVSTEGRSISQSSLPLDYLKNAGLSQFADTYPADLSGGMKQRLALARALAASPRLILMDEPFASFDPLVRESSQETILHLLSQRSTTILLVTHDLDEAIFMSDRILVLSERPGRIKEIVDVHLERPRVSGIRKDRRFHELRSHLWERLRSPIS